jgi:hypothetical protein
MEIPQVPLLIILLPTKAPLRTLTKLTTTRVINNNRIKGQVPHLLSSITDIPINIHLVLESKSYLDNEYWQG